MELGNLREQLDMILAELQGFSLSPEMIDALTTFATLAALQTQMGQQQVAMGQNEVGMAEVDLGLAQLDFQRNDQLPFQREQLENERLLAELGLTGKREQNSFEMALNELRLQQAVEQGEMSRERAAAELQQIREREGFDTFQENVARETALINLARAREQAAHEAAMLGNVRSRGSGQYTPSAGA